MITECLYKVNISGKSICKYETEVEPKFFYTGTRCVVCHCQFGKTRDNKERRANIFLMQFNPGGEFQFDLFDMKTKQNIVVI